MNNYYNNLKGKFVQKFIIWSTIYTAIVILLFFFFMFTLSQSTYFGDEFLYPFYKWANDNRYFSIFITLFCGYGLITLVLFKKLLGYTDEIIVAIDEIYMDDNSLISLSGELKDVTEKMNKIKFNLRENEKIAREAEKRKNDLIIYLAHDLKTPLTSIIGYLTILKDEIDVGEEFRDKYLNICYQKSMRLEDLINEFFEITRYNLNDMEIVKSNIDFSLMMNQIISEFTPLLKGKSLSINNEIEPYIKLDIDAKKMERVIDNIIRNAINYSKENGQIDVVVKKRNNVVNINIKNEGITIPSSKLEHIFDEFFRIDSSRSTEKGGAGLGLAIAKSIIVAHGGTISAKSEEGFVEMHVNIPI